MNRWLRLAASLAILFASLYLLDWGAIAETLQKASIGGLLAAFAVTLASFGMLAWRWYLIVQPLAPQRVVEHLRRYLVATYLNSFTPANLGGDIYRVMSLRSQSGTGVVLTAVLRERFLGLLSFLLVYVLLFPVIAASSAEVPQFLAYAWIATVLGVATLLLAPIVLTGPMLTFGPVVARPMLKRGIEVLDQAVQIERRPQFAILLGTSAFGVALWIAAVKIVALDLDIPISWQALGAIVVLAELLRMLPLTIQGLGLREATFAYLLAILGGAPESGFVLGAVSYAVLTMTLLACGLIGWLLPRVEGRP